MHFSNIVFFSLKTGPYVSQDENNINQTENPQTDAKNPQNPPNQLIKSRDQLDGMDGGTDIEQNSDNASLDLSISFRCIKS